jgi:sRNA-binding carbon storage regulator CsrA
MAGGLILSRREGERILFDLPSGEVIALTLLVVGRGKAKVHIVAPKQVVVWRGEIAPDEVRTVTPAYPEEESES